MGGLDPTDLSAITARFKGSEWQQSLAGPLRLSQMNQDQTAGLLHDTVGQNLSALGLELGVLLLDFKKTPELAGRVSHLQAVLEETIDKVRELSRLNSSVVDHSGLRFALEHLIETRRASSDVEFGLEYAGTLQVPRPAARAFLPIAECSIEHACISGATNIRVRISRETLGWILEVLYDVTSPQSSEELPAAGRTSLLLLEYYAIRSGLPVALHHLPGGASKLRAVYSSEDTHSARVKRAG
jgi:hypothetical protein